MDDLIEALRSTDSQSGIIFIKKQSTSEEIDSPLQLTKNSKQIKSPVKESNQLAGSKMEKAGHSDASSGYFNEFEVDMEKAPVLQLNLS